MSTFTDAPTVVPDKWDTSQIPSQRGKVAIVTGANSGLGYETALQLTRKGARVILACRNQQKGQEAAAAITGALKGTEGAGSVEFMALDTSDLSSVKAFVTRFLQIHDRLDLLVNNAGIMAVPYTQSVDGYESQFATNHLGHFALTAQLFGLLKHSSPSRIVNVSSHVHREIKHFDKDAIMLSPERYNDWEAYTISKVCNILFTLELQRRMQAYNVNGVTVLASHPGSTTTNAILSTAASQTWFKRFVWTLIWYLPLHQPVTMGALPILYAATAKNVKSGDFFGPNGFRAYSGYPTLEIPSTLAQSESAAKQLWTLSENLAKMTFTVEK